MDRVSGGGCRATESQCGLQLLVLASNVSNIGDGRMERGYLKALGVEYECHM